MQRLSITAASMSCAICLSVLMAVLILLSFLGYGEVLVRDLGTVLIGTDTSFAGLLVGTTWGFLLGGVFGAMFVWIYNAVVTYRE